MSSARESSDRELRTLTRGLELLEAIVDADGRATARSLAADLELSRSTCYQILKTLELSGYVVRATGGLYEVGPAFPAIFRRLRSMLSPGPRVLAALQELRSRTGDTTYACVLRGSGILLQEALQGRKELVVRSLQPGMRANLHARASCRAILAYLPDLERRRMLPTRALAELTPYTITSRRLLRAELASVAELGYAVERQEYELGVACVAAPFFDGTGRVAGSLTISLPVAELDQDERAIAATVMECARAAGYPREDAEASAA